MRYATCLFALWAVSIVRADEPKLPDGFEPLFNGRDLSGWKVYNGKQGVWAVEDGLLLAHGAGGGWLFTEKEYTNFEARLEYRLPKMGNSGFAFRAPREGQPHLQGMEIQIIDDKNWKDLKSWQHCGSLYGVVPAAKPAGKGSGEWNKLTVAARDKNVRVVLNGQTVVDADLGDHKDRAADHPGILRTRGHLGLQSYNFRVDFRRLYVKVLD